MLTKRQEEMINAYIPSPKDSELGPMEYYVKDSAERIQRVEIRDILPYKEETCYIVVQSNTRKQIKGWLDYGAFFMSDLYDNKEDCISNTHTMFNGWERLRELQEQVKKENETGGPKDERLKL